MCVCGDKTCTAKALSQRRIQTESMEQTDATLGQALGCPQLLLFAMRTPFIRNAYPVTPCRPTRRTSLEDSCPRTSLGTLERVRARAWPHARMIARTQVEIGARSHQWTGAQLSACAPRRMACRGSVLRTEVRAHARNAQPPHGQSKLSAHWPRARAFNSSSAWLSTHLQRGFQLIFSVAPSTWHPKTIWYEAFKCAQRCPKDGMWPAG
eukprot:6184296-Pleurochrysis_carterae.AAC.3